MAGAANHDIEHAIMVKVADVDVIVIGIEIAGSSA